MRIRRQNVLFRAKPLKFFDFRAIHNVASGVFHLFIKGIVVYRLYP